MKKFLYLISAACFLFASCDKLEGDERFEDYNPEVGSNKMILVEDYTGQKCVNCPGAAQMLSDLNNTLNNHLIIVSMHAGGFSMGTPLFNPIASQYMSALGLKNNPSVSIDKTVNIDGNSNTWSDPITERAKLSSICEIKTDLSYNADAKKFSAKSDIRFTEDCGEKLGVQYYVLRDGVISFQVDSEGHPIKDYEHNHVFSGTLYDDIWGMALKGDSDNTYKKGTVYHSEQTPEFVINKDWDPSKVSVVTFVFKYSGDDKSPIGEVLQANKVHLVNQ